MELQDHAMTSSSTLGQHPDLALPARSARCRHTPCCWADACLGDHHEQDPGSYACRSRSGRRRKWHTFLHESREGLRCIYCDRLQGLHL